MVMHIYIAGIIEYIYPILLKAFEYSLGSVYSEIYLIKEPNNMDHIFRDTGGGKVLGG